MMKFQVKRLGNQDVLVFQKLISLFSEVFEMEKPVEIEESYLIRLLEKPGFIAYCVILEDEVVGGLTAFELEMYYDMHSELFIYDVAIKPAFQRMGLGKKLILSLKKYCKRKGIRIMFVEAHEEDQYAVDFYRSTGGKAEKVAHFNYLINKEK